jgi:hypothetical protein
MKKLIVASIVGLSMLSFGIVHAEAEKKKACVKNEKTGKEVCKEIKVHKKLEVEPTKDDKKK